MGALKQPKCAQCGTTVPGFVQVTGKWLGNPVLYMGRDEGMGYARVYQFCEAECLLEWLAEVLGLEVRDA